MKKTIVAEGLRFPEGPVLAPDGSILLVEIERGTITRVTPDGKVTVVRELGGGPNGMAWGPDGALYVANNGGFLFVESGGLNRTRAGAPEGYSGGWIERYDPETDEHRVLYTQCDGHRFVGPNDLAFDQQGGFYFTDYGKTFARHRPHGGLYYGLADGSHVVEVAYPLISPNGTGVSPDDKVAYVAETDTGRLWAFDLERPGVASSERSTPNAPHKGRLVIGLPGYQRFDSLAVDSQGNIWVATLMSGCVTVISPEGEILQVIETGDPVTTNVVLAPSEREAWVTLSGTGRLMHLEW
ncbi:SMP-30/gluconolactonase/LRE family protein [Puniceibacterium sp. IMCC21224]|uniref:SMP-30/gluconolactonase/LRE family protein n=1 Tax=Puniceibacterium sp. IMCC21224 TaxID=1618204 RepID=UPI00065CDC60|nr:SMP-30/gluconolactonase/LRE family protein [Puniceibacterium sp. IMCC21224]KMK64942.1 gluconolactonase [Puniceibacterium sp. IMCC21224]